MRCLTKADQSHQTALNLSAEVDELRDAQRAHDLHAKDDIPVIRAMLNS